MVCLWCVGKRSYRKDTAMFTFGDLVTADGRDGIYIFGPDSDGDHTVHFGDGNNDWNYFKRSQISRRGAEIPRPDMSYVASGKIQAIKTLRKMVSQGSFIRLMDAKDFIESVMSPRPYEVNMRDERIRDLENENRKLRDQLRRVVDKLDRDDLISLLLD